MDRADWKFCLLLVAEILALSIFGTLLIGAILRATWPDEPQQTAFATDECGWETLFVREGRRIAAQTEDGWCVFEQLPLCDGRVTCDLGLEP